MAAQAFGAKKSDGNQPTGGDPSGSSQAPALKRATEQARILDEARTGEQGRRGLIAAGAMGIALATALALADFYTHSALAGSLLIIRALSGIAALAALMMVWSRTLRQRWKELALGLLLVLMIVSTAGQVSLGDVGGFGLTLLMCVVGASVFFPWSGRWQAGVNLAAIFCLLAAQSFSHSPLSESVYFWIALLVAAGLSQLNSLCAWGRGAAVLARLPGMRRDAWGGASRVAEFWPADSGLEGLVSTISGDGVILGLSPWAVDALGYAQQEIIGVHVRELIHPDDLGAACAALAHALRTPGDAAFVEFRFRHRDGSWRELESALQAAHDVFWNKRVLVFARDITERRQRERKLAETEARFKEVFEASSDAILVVRLRDQRILDANPAFAQLTGFSPEQARGWTPLQLNLWADFAQREAFYDALENKGALHDKEFLLRSKDGHVRPVLVSAVKSQWDGEPCVICILHDIGEIRRVEAQLSLSEARFRQVFDSSLDAIVITNFDDGKLVEVNDEFLRETGLTREQALGRTAAELGLWLDPQARAALKRTLFTEGQVRNFEAAFRTKDGSVAQHLVNATAVEIGGERRVILISRDITPLKRAERELIEARERALAASNAKSEFLSNMSHEIRTPLNAVLGAAELLAESPLSTDQRRHLGTLRANGSALLELVNDILDLAKIESRHLSLEHISFNLEESVEAVMRAMALRARQKYLELAARIAPGTPLYLRGDPSRLRQVLTNLLGNAIKFTERGEVTLEVEREPGPGAAAVLRFEVRDTGIGVSADKLDDVFRAFTQADSSTTRKYGGSGLGLAISERLVTAMGGRMWATSEPGKGSSFYFTANFELRPALAQAPAAAPAREPAPSAQGARAPLRILLAEDSGDNLLVIETFLKDSPHLIDVAEDGAAAVKRFMASDYELVLMDMQMPVMDGYVATRAIRKWERERGRRPCRILALTAYALRSEMEKSLAAGCDAYLTKPISKATLLQAVNEAATLLAEASKAPPLAPAAPVVTVRAGI